MQRRGAVFISIVLLMVLSLVLIPNFALERFVLPFSILFAGFATLIWLQGNREQFRAITSFWRKAGHFPWNLMLAAGYPLVWILLTALILGHFPKPSIHDEFSYILGARTFAEGRLTNPTPLGWEHFESFHVLVQPSYQTKYQPGMSLMLAVGIVLTGEPFVGVLLALMLASVAVCWMLGQWLPRRWVLPMTLLAATIMLQLWGTNYFVAGPLATIAGAVQLGLAQRQLKKRLYSWWDGWLWGLSLVLLMFTRPFEGAVFSLLMGLGMLYGLYQQGRLGPWLGRMVPGILMTLGPACWGQLEYNLAVTGSRWTLPYVIFEKQYSVCPLFLFQKLLPPPEYRHAVIELFNRQMAEFYLVVHAPNRWLEVFCFRFGLAWKSYGLLLCALPFLVIPELWRTTRLRCLLLLVLAVLLIVQLVTWFLPHYLAPVWPAWTVLLAESIRRVRLWQCRNRQAGRGLVIVCVLNSVCFLGLSQWLIPAVFPAGWTAQREGILIQLQQEGGKHLVLVEYGPEHNTGQEWVYNGPLLDEEPVLWARSMDVAKNQRLIGLYPGRTVWLLRADAAQREAMLHRYEALPGTGSGKEP